MKVTQRDRILALFQAGGWVSALTLSQISLRYGARIMELRKMGYEIEIRRKIVRGVNHSDYRLVHALETPQDALQTLLEGWYERVTSPHKEDISNEASSGTGPGTTSRHGGGSANLHAS